jgi:hypothetical protein
MGVKSRVESLERATGNGQPCALCERRAAEVERSPVMREGFVENPGDTYELNCPGCGSPFTLQIVYVEQREAA